MRRPYLKGFEAYPLVVAARVDHAIPPERQRDLLSLFDDIVASGARMHDRTQIRSKSSAFHIGTWEKSSPVPYLTRDTRHQRPEAKVAIHAFMRYVSQKIAPIYKRHMSRLVPEQMERLARYVVILSFFELSSSHFAELTTVCLLCSRTP